LENDHGRREFPRLYVKNILMEVPKRHTSSTSRTSAPRTLRASRYCPVECIHPTPEEAGFEEAEQLYIDPDECIDCDACVEACPVDAITPEDMVPPE
jgi:NAD-dependent dihydropyrimidine dehydrogenase PreA subunit